MASGEVKLRDIMGAPEQILQALRQSPRIPAPSQVVSRILSLTRNPDCSINSVADLIQRDGALTGELLRQANSVLFTAARPTSSVKDACVRLGLKRVRSVAINDHVINGLGKTCPPGFDAHRYWQGALATSVAARDLAQELLPDMVDDAGTAGLLVDVGIGLLAYGVSHEYGTVLSRMSGNLSSDHEAMERRCIGLTHSDVGFAILSDWKLDSHLCEAVRRHHVCNMSTAEEHDRFARIVGAAVTCSQIALCGSDLATVERLFNQIGALDSRPDEVVNRILDQLVIHVQKTAEELQIELGGTEELECNLTRTVENHSRTAVNLSYRPMDRRNCSD